MGVSQRRKGGDYERRIARLLRAIFGGTVRRGWQARKGDDAPDVIAPQLSVECKHRVSPIVRAALKQAIASAEPGCWPVAICRWSGQKGAAAEIAAMPLADWLDLVREWHELRSR